MDIQVVKHAANYLVGGLIHPDPDDEHDARTAVISRMEFGWLEKTCPGLYPEHLPESFSRMDRYNVSNYLHAVFPGYHFG
jgi:hypothetical protein